MWIRGGKREAEAPRGEPAAVDVAGGLVVAEQIVGADPRVVLLREREDVEVILRPPSPKRTVTGHQTTSLTT